MQHNPTSLRSEIVVSFLLAMGLGINLDCATMGSHALSSHALASEFHDDFATAVVLRMRLGHVIFLALGTRCPRRSPSGTILLVETCVSPDGPDAFAVTILSSGAMPLFCLRI